MRKYILLVMMALMCCLTVSAQHPYTRSGDTFTAMTKAKEKVEPTKTKYFYTDSHGDKYPIFMSSTGSCFINKVSSKTGKEYRMYLGKDISMEICKEMGVEYKGKK